MQKKANGTESGGRFHYWKCTFHLDDEPDKNGEWDVDGHGALDRFNEIKEFLRADFVFGQFERGKENQKLHLQALLHFRTAVRGSHFKDKLCWTEGMHFLQAQHHTTYVSKDETRIAGPFRVGKVPRGLFQEPSMDDVWEAAKNGDLEKIPAGIRIRHYRTLKQIRADHIKPTPRTPPCAIWVWGDAGTGKSRFVRSESFLNGRKLYLKGKNKWWCGFDGEEVVLLEDLGESDRPLLDAIKNWADIYPLSEEIKGSTTGLNYQLFVVTSQYHPVQLWPNRSQDVEAICRRFRIRNKSDVDIWSELPDQSEYDRYMLEDVQFKNASDRFL